MGKKSKVVNLATGVAIGSLFGILFAPKSGSETRKILKSKFREITDKVTKTNSKEFAENVDNMIYVIKVELDNLEKEENIENLKTKIENLNKRIEDLINYVNLKGNEEIKTIASEIKQQTTNVTKDVQEKLQKRKKL